MVMEKILVVDDEKGVCHSFKKILGRHGYDVVTAGDGIEAIEKAERYNPSLVIMDVSMPRMDGIETLQRLKASHPSLIVILMTAHSTSERAITAMKYGAYDYLTKPFDNARLLSLIEKAIMDSKMSTPVTFDEDREAQESGDRIIGKSPAMLEILKKTGQVASSDATVLIQGESGAGKELIARAIYHHSRRVNRPFLPVNCSAIPETLLESELFGHERGAFTGADSRRIGKFEQCSGGTMFLDEIGDMPLSIQAKWLRVLEDGCFQRVGGADCITSDVRIIAATDKDLERLVEKGTFSNSLYWRLNVFIIEVPPLRERKEDIEALIAYFIKKYNAVLGKEIRGASHQLLEEFSAFHWPGNVRQLQSVIQRGMVLCQSEYLTLEDCEWTGKAGFEGQSMDIEELLTEAASALLKTGGPAIYRDAIEAFERILVKKALNLSHNNQVLTAKLLGISRNTLRSKLDRDSSDKD